MICQHLEQFLCSSVVLGHFFFDQLSVGALFRTQSCTLIPFVYNEAPAPPLISFFLFFPYVLVLLATNPSLVFSPTSSLVPSPALSPAPVQFCLALPLVKPLVKSTIELSPSPTSASSYYKNITTLHQFLVTVNTNGNTISHNGTIVPSLDVFKISSPKTQPVCTKCSVFTLRPTPTLCNKSRTLKLLLPIESDNFPRAMPLSLCYEDWYRPAVLLYQCQRSDPP